MKSMFAICSIRRLPLRPNSSASGVSRPSSSTADSRLAVRVVDRTSMSSVKRFGDLDVRGHASTGKRRAVAVDQPVARFRSFQQRRAAVGTRVGLIERRDEGFVEEIWEENSLWYGVVAQSKASVWEKARVATALYHAEAFVSLLESAPS